MSDQVSTPGNLSTVLTDSAPVAIYHYIAPDLPLYTNPAFRTMFGLEAADDVEAWILRIHPEDRTRVRAAWASFESKRDDEFVAQYRRVDPVAGIRVVLERVVPAVGVAGFVGTITDVTELVDAQAELERIHKALISTSRQAGMAEVATNVLHNVGNVLNSINVSANLLESRLKELRISGLSRVAAMLQQQGEGLSDFLASDRGKTLPSYLVQLSSQLLADQNTALQELASLVGNLEHIKNIVQMQQSYAANCSVCETVAVIDLVNDSVRLNAAGFTRHGVELELDAGETPSIRVDKHKVLQILVNLIRNAKYACDESKRTDKRITIRTRSNVHGVCIGVVDNGIGNPRREYGKTFHAWIYDPPWRSWLWPPRRRTRRARNEGFNPCRE